MSPFLSKWDLVSRIVLHWYLTGIQESSQMSILGVSLMFLRRLEWSSTDKREDYKWAEKMANPMVWSKRADKIHFSMNIFLRLFQYLKFPHLDSGLWVIYIQESPFKGKCSWAGHSGASLENQLCGRLSKRITSFGGQPGQHSLTLSQKKGKTKIKIVRHLLIWMRWLDDESSCSPDKKRL